MIEINQDAKFLIHEVPHDEATLPFGVLSVQYVCIQKCKIIYNFLFDCSENNLLLLLLSKLLLFRI